MAELDPVWLRRTNRAVQAYENRRGTGVSDRFGSSERPATVPRHRAAEQESADLPVGQYEGDMLMMIGQNQLGFALGYAINVVPAT